MIYAKIPEINKKLMLPVSTIHGKLEVCNIEIPPMVKPQMLCSSEVEKQYCIDHGYEAMLVDEILLDAWSQESLEEGMEIVRDLMTPPWDDL